MNQISAVRNVERTELREGLRDGSILLVDVREPHEFAAGSIPGSMSMPLSRFRPAEPPAERRIVFSCAAGVRSLKAIDLARAAGLDLNEHYPGGFKDWLQSGEEIA